MQWLVAIDEEGVQMQYLMGVDTEKAAKEESGLKNKAKCIFKTHERLKLVFEFGYDPIDPRGSHNRKMSRDEERQWDRDFQNFYNNMKEKLSKKYKASSPREKYGYDIRKTTLRNYIEVLADLDAKDYDQFRNNYSGLDGAIDILGSTIKLLHPHADTSIEASEKVTKWITKLQNEKELKD